MNWKLTKNEIDQENLLINESLLSLGNGYLGVRGNFEEGYAKGMKSIRGIYINAFHDETEITYGEKLHAFPETQQKMVNVIDAQGIEIYIDEERFSLFEGELLGFERYLHFDKGFSERIVHWRSPGGKEVRIHFRRLISFLVKELFVIDVTIEPISKLEKIKIISTVNGDVSNYVDKNDPRVASGHAKRLNVVMVKADNQVSYVKNRTLVTEMEVVCATSSKINVQDCQRHLEKNQNKIQETYTCSGEHAVHFTKYNTFTDTLRHGKQLEEYAVKLNMEMKEKSIEHLLREQSGYMADFWESADVKIDGDTRLQEGIRFNLFQLLQSAGRDSVSNIAAKGLSGEGYEGHYFWDTEIYMFPVFLMTKPDIAKGLLLHRYSLLEYAKQRAKEMGHEKGALYPWRTITGGESSAFFPAGTAQYHISADIAYSFIQYYIATKDITFLQQFGAEVLFETARLWADTGHYLNGEFRIDNVTGPDEYTCIVNNNFYTNAMAKYNLLWAARVYQLLEEQGELASIKAKIELKDEEAEEWKTAGENMYLPYDKELKIHAQDDSFLQKARWDLDNTPKDKFPLLLNYHPLTLYRYQVCKQADTVLSHFLLEDDMDIETMKYSYDYYEPLTTHDSSLSYCIFSIMASKLGYREKAYDYFIETARLDLDNTHGNTKDGLHMANMGGTWLAMVFGFAGLRLKESGLSFVPYLPKKWTALSFQIQYLDSKIQVEIKQDSVIYTLEKGNELTILSHGEEVVLEPGIDKTVPFKIQK